MVTQAHIVRPCCSYDVSFARALLKLETRAPRSAFTRSAQFSRHQVNKFSTHGTRTGSVTESITTKFNKSDNFLIEKIC